MLRRGQEGETGLREISSSSPSSESVHRACTEIACAASEGLDLLQFVKSPQRFKTTRQLKAAVNRFKHWHTLRSDTRTARLIIPGCGLSRRLRSLTRILPFVEILEYSSLLWKSNFDLACSTARVLLGAHDSLGSDGHTVRRLGAEAL